MTATYRDYALSDHEACVAICQSCVPRWVAPHEVDEFAGFLEAQTVWDCRYGVLDVPSVGIVACGGMAYGSDGIATLCWGLVHRDHHKTGLGRRLLEVRLAWLDERPDMHTVRLHTTQHTEGFFAHFGFTTRAVDEDFYAPGLHRHAMVRALIRASTLPA